MPLQSGDVMAALREAEANLRREGREKADLAKLGPGALELASLMDRTASFLLAQLPAALTALTPSGGYVARARSTAAGPGGRLAAPLPDVPPASQATVGAFAMTTQGFEMLVSSLAGSLTSVVDYTKNCPPPCSVTKTFDPTTDEVTIAGNKAKITTTVTAVATVNGSKVSLDITVKVEGEVRDSATGAFLYRIVIEATGHADGDACPDPSGTARARLVFGGRESYFHANGTRSESAIGGGWSADLRIKVDDNAALAGVDLTTTGGDGAHFIMG